jgi:hypothetical protein
MKVGVWDKAHSIHTERIRMTAVLRGTEREGQGERRERTRPNLHDSGWQERGIPWGYDMRGNDLCKERTAGTSW